MGAFFGGAGAAGYAAANACVEALAADARRVGARSVCLTWSLWEGTGMARAFAKGDAARARGQRAIGRREGLASLLAILARGEAAAYVGLDDANRVVRSALRGVPPPARRLVAVVEAPEPAPAAQAIDDGFGVAVPLDGRQVPRLPRLASGAVDREALRLPGALERGAAAEAPRSDVEARRGRRGTCRPSRGTATPKPSSIA